MTTKRRMRLAACAMMRAVWHRRLHDQSRAAVVVAELYADGLASDCERRSAAIFHGDPYVFAAARCADDDEYIHLSPNIVADATGLHSLRNLMLSNPSKFLRVPPREATLLAIHAYKLRCVDGSMDQLTLSALADCLEESGEDAARLRSAKLYRGDPLIDLLTGRINL